MDSVLISVIIPCYNSGKTIRECLESVLNQSIREGFEVVVVDNNSEDNSVGIIKDYPVKLVHEKEGGSYVARGSGVKNAGGSILVFLDSDCVPTKNWLSELVSLIISGRECVVMGYINNFDDGRWSRIEQKKYDEFLENETEEGYIHTVSCGNFAIKRSVFTEVGGFNTALKWSGDVDLGIKLRTKGFKILFNKKAEVRHHQRTSLWKLMTHKFEQAYWDMEIYSKSKTFLGEHRRVINEVKVAFFFLLFSTLSLFAYILFAKIIFARFFLFGFPFSLFFVAGSTHTLLPLVRNELSDEKLFDLSHTIFWRTGALYYMMKNPWKTNRL